MTGIEPTGPFIDATLKKILDFQEQMFKFQALTNPEHRLPGCVCPTSEQLRKTNGVYMIYCPAHVTVGF